MLYRTKRFLVRLAIGWLAVLTLSACGADTRQKMLKTLFDISDTPPVPTQRVRRDLLQEIENLKRKLAQAEQEKKTAQEAAKEKGVKRTAPPIEKAKTWEEAEKLLPKDKSGEVDWVQAIKAGTVAPRPSPNPTAPEQAVLDMDVELASSAHKVFHVTYSHSVHTAWLACASCHPAIFPLRQAKPAVVTMAKIKAGEYCGVCHGKVAFAVDNECGRCHSSSRPTVEWHAPEPRKPVETARTWDEAAKLLPATGGTVDWSKALSQGMIAPRAGIDRKAQDQAVLPLDVELVPTAGEMFKVVFPHKPHTEWLGCPNCHTGIFQMAKGTDPITMEKINAGQYCGVCHGKVAFAATTCGRCHPAMGGGK